MLFDIVLLRRVVQQTGALTYHLTSLVHIFLYVNSVAFCLLRFALKLPFITFILHQSYFR
jgi:hypothetical protein